MSPDRFLPIPLDDEDGQDMTVDVPEAFGAERVSLAIGHSGQKRAYLSPDAARALASALEEAAAYAELRQLENEGAAMAEAAYAMARESSACNR